MKIAIGGLMHETNTFAEGLTTYEDFISPGGHPPANDPSKLISSFVGVRNGIGGIVEAGLELKVDLVPLIWLFPQPSGTVSQDAWDKLSARFLKMIEDAMPLDGVALDMHGAMVTEKHEDAEGNLIERIRAIVGPDVPIVSVLDLHANITEKMVANANALVGYDTYPHIDSYDRGKEVMQMVVDAVAGKIKPVCALAQIPMLIGPPKQCTLISPMRDIIEMAHEAEREDGILSVTMSGGFPFSDIHDVGASVVVNADGDIELAQQKAKELADKWWERREEFKLDLSPLKETIENTIKEGKGPVILADGSDN
ncbi:MAG: M81 family metallopeptidase, partial [Lentisphaerae bacterium]|nr:M81 family metallopeptidase [Lentisphaerota bacterium]